MPGGGGTGHRWSGRTVLTSRRSVIVISTDPHDPDDDFSRNARLDINGDSVLAFQPWLRVAADGLRRAELGTAFRAPPDRHFYRWVVSGDVSRLLGISHTISIISARAGGCGGIGKVVIDADTIGGHRIIDDSTSRLDLNGDTLAPPVITLKHAMDSLLRADLVTEMTDQDRWRPEWVLSGERLGHRSTMVLESDGRAGEAGGIRQLAVRWDTVGGGLSRVKDYVT